MPTSDVLPIDWPVTSYIEQLRKHREKLVAHYRIDFIGVFGSYIRNEQTEHSDLDVLVSFSKTPTLFTLVDLEDELSKLLGVPVDLVVKTDLKRRIGQRILQEVIEL
jgi:hypothetical protein